jgi:hypothetical protein
VAPVDPAFLGRGRTALELAEELRVDGEVLGDGEQLLVELPQPLGRDRGDGAVRGRGLP